MNSHLVKLFINTIIAVAANLSKYNGLRFDLYFDDNILSVYHDSTPFLIIIICSIILSILFAVKFIFFNKNKLIPVMNFRITNYINPLYIDKFMHQYILPNDVTLLIYYWANMNFISITFVDENETILTKTCDKLPERAPKYQHILFDDIFKNEDEVKVSSLEKKFYHTITKVCDEVNSIQFIISNGNSVCVSFLFALLSGFLMSIFPYISCKMNISSKLYYFHGFFFYLSVFIIWMIGYDYSYDKIMQKSDDEKFNEILTFSIITTIIYTFYINDEIMEKVSKILLCVFCYAIIFYSINIICPADEIINILNEAIGLKKFIHYTSKEKIKLLIIDDPQLYYNLLPYAYVFGMSKIWKSKFDELKIDPPLRMIIHKNNYFDSTETRNEGNSYLYNHFNMWDNYIQNSRKSMNYYFNSQPQPKYCSTNHHNTCNSSINYDDCDCYGGDGFGCGDYGGDGHGGGGGDGI